MRWIAGYTEAPSLAAPHSRAIQLFWWIALRGFVHVRFRWIRFLLCWRAAWTCELSLIKQAGKASSDWRTPMFSFPAGKLVNERLMVFNFNMQTRRFHSAYVCDKSAPTEGRRGSLFVHKWKFKILNPCHINETETWDPAGEYQPLSEYLFSLQPVLEVLLLPALIHK